MLGGDVPDNGGAAGAFNAGYENVVPGLVMLSPKSMACTALSWPMTSSSGSISDVFFKLEDVGVTGVAQFGCGQFAGFLHRQLLYSMLVSQFFRQDKFRNAMSPK
jgi:hypothetical protein